MQKVIYFSRFKPKMAVIMTFDDILLLHSRRSYTCIAHNTNIPAIVPAVMTTPSSVLALI